MSPVPAPRSLLYVPAHNEKLLAGASRRKADAIILDLEDSVPTPAKDRARQRLDESVDTVGAQGARVLVRVNSPWTLAWRDVEAAVAADAHGIVLTKVDSAARIEAVGAYLLELEAHFGRHPLSLLVTIETAIGLSSVQAIAETLAQFGRGAVNRLTALIPGNEDLSLSLHLEPEPGRMVGAIWPIILAARAHDHMLLGSIGSGAEFRDLETYRQTVERSRAHGFDGATCIHPAQVEVVNDVYRSSDADLAWAAQVVTAFEAGDGEAVGVDGHMVDRPIYLRAKRLIEEASR